MEYRYQVQTRLRDEGAWTVRYNAYHEETALNFAKHYRSKGYTVRIELI